MTNRSSRVLVIGLGFALAAVALVVFRRLAGAGFFHDDWTLLARGAGVLPPPPWPARPLAFDLYWRLLDPLPGYEPVVYTVTRFAVHLATGFVVSSIVRRLGGTVLAAWLAAAVYVLSPLAFEALYWAAAITDLLANLGLLLSVLGLLRADRKGLALLLLGGVISLTSKETGWWLALAAGIVWWRSGRRSYLAAAVVLLALTGFSLLATARGLEHDYAWTAGAVPWNLLRAGSWLVPRPLDLIRVWEADATTLATGAGVWLAWLSWGVWRLRRQRDPVPSVALACALLALTPSLGLAGHMVPRYLLPVQAALAVSIATALPRAARGPLFRAALAAAAVVGLALMTGWQVDRLLDMRFRQGRPAHRLVAKDAMVRVTWRTLLESGARPGEPLAFYRPPGDAPAPREYVLDVIGRTWGPRLTLGRETSVVIVDDLADVAAGTRVFRVDGFELEHLGVLRRRPRATGG
jgi:hypothetical protein